jgi:hypothetical protein
LTLCAENSTTQSDTPKTMPEVKFIGALLLAGVICALLALLVLCTPPLRAVGKWWHLVTGFWVVYLCLTLISNHRNP